MLSLFQRKRVPTPPAAPLPPTINLSKELTRPQSATQLLATPRRQKLLEHIWQRTSLSRKQFATLYLAPLERYAELVQQFPASESHHHHAYLGGMLDHGLEIVAYALKLRQSYLLPSGTTPEDQAAQSEAWTAAAAYAALLHDIGKVAVDLHVELADGSIWHPWHGPLQQCYRFRYRPDREYSLHSAATGLLYTHVLNPAILDWLSSFRVLWASLLYVLAGQYEHAGVLGELVVQADRASVAQALGGDPTKAMAAPKHALQRKPLDGLRYLLKQELKLNQPQASDGWLTEDALWLVSKTVSDKLRAHLLSQGIDGIPANNSAVFNVLQDHGMLQPTPDGKAIWRATISSNSGWSHSFTLLRLAPALIWESGERPEPFTGTVAIEAMPVDADADSPAEASAPVTQPTLPRQEAAPSHARPPQPPQSVAVAPDAIADILAMIGGSTPAAAVLPEADTPAAQPAPPWTEAPASLQADPANEAAPTHPPSPPNSTTSQPSGEHFMAWLRNGISTRKLIINDAKALVHTVDGTAYLVSPGLFQRYAQEHPQTAVLARQEQVADWQWVQKRFEKLGLHRKQANGLNIWSCEISGPRKSKRLHGYLLSDAQALFETPPPDNPYLHLSMVVKN